MTLLIEMTVCMDSQTTMHRAIAEDDCSTSNEIALSKSIPSDDLYVCVKPMTPRSTANR